MRQPAPIALKCRTRRAPGCGGSTKLTTITAAQAIEAEERPRRRVVPERARARAARASAARAASARRSRSRRVAPWTVDAKLRATALFAAAAASARSARRIALRRSRLTCASSPPSLAYGGRMSSSLTRGTAPSGSNSLPPSEGNSNDRGGVTICGAASVGMSRGDTVAIAAVLVCAVVRAGQRFGQPKAMAVLMHKKVWSNVQKAGPRHKIFQAGPPKGPRT